MGLFMYRLSGLSLLWLGRWRAEHPGSFTSATPGQASTSKDIATRSYTLFNIAATVLASGGCYAACTGQLLKSSPYRSLNKVWISIQLVRTTQGNEGIYRFQCTGLVSWFQLEVCPFCQVLDLAPHVL